MDIQNTIGLIFIRKNRILFLSIILALMLILPLVGLAQEENERRLVPCDGPDCNFNSFLIGINRIISWFITVGALIAALGFAWVGFIYITRGGNPSERQKANAIFSKIAMGFFFLLASFLIVKLIIAGLGGSVGGEGSGEAIKFLDL